jgi:hypothetical protein
VIVLAPVKSTCCPKLRVLAPETVILAPTWIVFAFVKIRFVGAVSNPTAPEKITFPTVPALNSKVLPTVQFNILEKLMSAPLPTVPPFVVSKTIAPVREPAPTSPILPPLVVMFPPMLIAVEPTEEAV